MKFIANSLHSKKTTEITYAYFDVQQVLTTLEQELLVKVCLINNELKVIFSILAKRQLLCYYVDLNKLEDAIIRYIKKNRSGLIPPNYSNTNYDNVFLIGKK